jgi:hypothetical protein
MTKQPLYTCWGGRGYRALHTHWAHLTLCCLLLPACRFTEAEAECLARVEAHEDAEIDACELSQDREGECSTDALWTDGHDAKLSISEIPALLSGTADVEAEFGITIPVVIVPRLNDALVIPPHTYRDTCRATLAAWELADPGARVAIDTDDQALKIDGTHWTGPMVHVVGGRVGAQTNRVKDL